MGREASLRHREDDSGARVVEGCLRRSDHGVRHSGDKAGGGELGCGELPTKWALQRPRRKS
jgi:hypothetical protein